MYKTKRHTVRKVMVDSSCLYLDIRDGNLYHNFLNRDVKNKDKRRIALFVLDDEPIKPGDICLSGAELGTVLDQANGSTYIKPLDAFYSPYWVDEPENLHKVLATSMIVKGVKKISTSILRQIGTGTHCKTFNSLYVVYEHTKPYRLKLDKVLSYLGFVSKYFNYKAKTTDKGTLITRLEK